MWVLLLRVLVEMLVGFTVAGVALAVGIPLLIRTGLISHNGVSGPLVIVGTVGLAIGVMLTRPGSALRRYRQK
jgi:hypothetical protein